VGGGGAGGFFLRGLLKVWASPAVRARRGRAARAGRVRRKRRREIIVVLSCQFSVVSECNLI
jgi:hypothetical protein